MADGEKSHPIERNQETGTNPFLPQDLSWRAKIYGLRLKLASSMDRRRQQPSDPWRNNLSKDRYRLKNTSSCKKS